jgi:membrane protein implicated in regulation of membrane protease activity
MATKVFDRETLLDLLVNGIPLFILLFFIGVFLALPAFGLGGLATGLQFAIVGVSFLALAILTYIVGKAVSTAEKTGTVYMPGQATVRGSKPLEEREEALESDESAGALDAGDQEDEATDANEEPAEAAQADADASTDDAEVETDADETDDNRD